LFTERWQPRTYFFTGATGVEFCFFAVIQSKHCTKVRTAAVDGTVSHVADWDVLQLVDVVVITTASTELHLNRVRVNVTVAVTGGTRHAHRNTDRAWSGGCSR